MLRNQFTYDPTYTYDPYSLNDLDIKLILEAAEKTKPTSPILTQDEIKNAENDDWLPHQERLWKVVVDLVNGDKDWDAGDVDFLIHRLSIGEGPFIDRLFEGKPTWPKYARIRIAIACRYEIRDWWRRDGKRAQEKNQTCTLT